MWLPEQRVEDWLESVDARHRARAGPSVALPARGLSERAAQRGHGARALVAGARRRRGGDVSDGDGAARGGRATNSTRSPTSRGPAGARGTTSNTGPTASGSGSAAAPIRPATAFAGRMSRPPRSTSIGSDADESTAVDVRRLSHGRAPGRRAVYRPAAVDGVDLDAISPRYGVDVWARYGAELEPFLEAGCLRREGAAAVADPPGNASCSRGDGGFRVAPSTLK